MLTPHLGSLALSILRQDDPEFFCVEGFRL